MGQVIVPHAPRSGLHVTLQSHEVPHDVAPHAPEPVQLSVHRPMPHCRSPHAPPPVQVRSHVPVAQLTVPHAVIAEPEPEPEPLPEPVQPIVQRASPHEMLPHAPSTPQVTSHEEACVQEMAPHAPGVGQLIVQFQPGGHVTSLPAPLIMQLRSTKLHVGHWLGHTGLSGAASSFTLGSTTQ